MLFLAVVALLSSVLGTCWGGVESGEWSVYSYPDSPLENPTACGRTEPSFVCDPNHLLPELDVAVIEETAEEVYEGTTIPCYDRQGRKKGGFRIMVAAMPKMVRTFTSNDTDSRQTRYREAQFFSYILGHYKWNTTASHCSETTIILYSEQDGVLYTSTQGNAAKVLTNDRVQDVNYDLVIRHYPVNTSPERAANAIKYMVNRYSDYFLGE